MDFNFDFNLVRSQKLLLIPQLKLALDILEMDCNELSDYIENQLETNPALEAETDARPEQEDFEDENEAQNEEYSENALSLKQHLLIQFNTMHLDKSDFLIGEYLIDNISDNGYLKVDIPEVAEFFNVPRERVALVLEKLQSLDPPGICARNLKECLLLQLKQMDERDDDAINIVEKYLDKIALDDPEYVAVQTGLPAEKVREVFKKVRCLEPIPGREFYSDNTQRPAPPDIIVNEENGGFAVYCNDEAFPTISISESFKIGASLPVDGDNGYNARENVKNAIWLIKCLEQRKKIIFDIASRLTEWEKDFFGNGRKSLKPLDKEEVASYLNMHISILDKALRGKTLQCRWGIFALESFFGDDGIKNAR